MDVSAVGASELAALVSRERQLPTELLDAVEWHRPPVGWEVHGHRFAYRTTDAGLDAHLDAVFGDLTPLTEDRAGASDVEVFSFMNHPTDDGPRWAAYAGRDRVFFGQAPSAVVGLLTWRCNQGVITSLHDDCLTLHAGAVARDGRAILLPAPMESGKTTLTAGLLRRGFDYLTDEAAALDRSTLLLRSYPKALSIDRGSWDLFPELAPEPDESVFVADQWQVPATRIGGGRVLGTAEPAVVVVPRYDPEGGTALERVRPSEMVGLLAESTFHFDRHAVEDLQGHARLVEGCVYARLAVDDLETACDLLTDLLDDVS